ncbi:hypothetical protein [Microbacterium sp. A94]|uniref:hypothetical protein n=1 Tax=Microbacterium sp. A94 TaxID=3450717 RepID=UPI003F42DD21
MSRSLAFVVASLGVALMLTGCASSKESSCEKVASLMVKQDALLALVESPDDAELYERTSREIGDGFAEIDFGNEDVDKSIDAIEAAFKRTADVTPLIVSREIDDDELEQLNLTIYGELAKVKLYCQGLIE